jgi:hypothetical protein
MVNSMPHAKILLIEDEAPLRGLLSRYLERQGHSVTACGDGSEALKVISGGAAIDVAVVDLTLPDIDGEALALQLLDSSDKMRIIISSGRLYSTEALPAAARWRVAALLKPYLPQQLLDTLTQLLGGGDQPSIS